MEIKTAKTANAVMVGYDTDYVFRTIEKTGDFYEAAILKKWTPLLGEPKTILDIGANLGNHTVYWGLNLRPNRLIAFEPYEDNYSLLCENIKN